MNATLAVVAPRSLRPSLTTRQWPRRAMVWSLLFALAAGLFVAGMEYRRWTWALTAPVRFGDIHNGYRWGYSAATEGYLNQYERMAGQRPEAGRWLDYAPLRLAVMTVWTKWTLERFGDSGGSWQPAYEFSHPVLMFNAAMEFIAAAAAFLLVRAWAIRCAADPPTAGVWAWFRRTLLRRRTDEVPLLPRAVSPYTGLTRATLAAATLWFNPAMALSAHGWPTWDMWIIPMFLLAVWLCVRGNWFVAGLFIGAGAMFKGQQLGAAPVFLLWPLLQGRYRDAGKWVTGVLLAIALVASPWMLSYLEPQALGVYRHNYSAMAASGQTPPLVSSASIAESMGARVVPRLLDREAIAWVAGLTLLSIAGPLTLQWRRRRTMTAASADLGPTDYDPLAAPKPPVAAWRRVLTSRWTRRAAIGIITLGVVVWPWVFGTASVNWVYAALAAALLLAAVCFIPRRATGYLAALTLALSLFSCMLVFRGSVSWWYEGVMFGNRHWPWMIMGRTSNLPGLLDRRFGNFGWAQYRNDVTQTLYTLEPGTLGGLQTAAIDISAKQFFGGIYGLTLLLTAVGVSMHHARRDPRFLIAITTPWVLFFSIPTQIHERYLLYAAGVGMIMIGHSLGAWLLAAFMTAATWIMTMHVMAENANSHGMGQALADVFGERWFSPETGGKITRFCQGTFPDIGWAILLCAAVMLYLTLTPGRRGRRPGAVVSSDG